MGLIVNEILALPSGIEVPSYYASFGDQARITIEKRIDFNSTDITYRLEGILFFWKDKTARNNKSQSIGNKFISLASTTPPETNTFSVLYDEFKKGLTSFTDDL